MTVMPEALRYSHYFMSWAMYSEENPTQIRGNLELLKSGGVTCWQEQYSCRTMLTSAQLQH